MTDAANPAGPQLAGCRVLVTRERPGELGRLLAERGANVIHAPLIGTADPADGGRDLDDALGDLDSFDWLVVTSASGAERVGDAARRHPFVRLAAVGTVTARLLEALAGRPADIVPDRQLAAELARAINAAAGLPPAKVLVAQADRAPNTLVEALQEGGHDIRAVTAYRTVLVPPNPDLIAGADVLALASGSAAQSWVEAVGADSPLIPPLVVAIGPTTADIAQKLGLKVQAVSTDHSIAGLVDEIGRRFPQ